MNLGIEGRRALVAAASSGLVFESAKALAAEGVHVTICGSDETRIRTAADSLGDKADWLVADVSVPDGAEKMVHEAAAKMGGVDILVVNGPGPEPGSALTVPVDSYRAAIDRSLLSVVAMTLAAVPAMVDAEWGRIVAITSVGVKQPLPGLVLSNTARAGATGFLKTLSREVAQHGVTVNSVLPGLHDTARVKNVYGNKVSDALATVPARCLGEPSDFGKVVAMLCSDYAKYLTGLTMPVDGGAVQGLL